MSGTREKMRAVLLAFVMVTSIVAVGVAGFAGTTSAAIDANGNIQDVPGGNSNTALDIASLQDGAASGDDNDGTTTDDFVINTEGDGTTAAVKIDLQPLVDAGVNISNADVVTNIDDGSNEGGTAAHGDSVQIDRISNGEIRLLVSDEGNGVGTRNDDDNVVILEQLRVTGLDTSNVDTASGLSFLVQVDDSTNNVNNGNFGSGFEVDAATETDNFDIATIEVENVATGNTVTESSLPAAIEEVNDPTQGDLDSGSAGDQQVIRPNSGTYTFDTDDISAVGGAAADVLDASNVRIQPRDGSDVTIQHSTDAASLLDVNTGENGIEIQNITFDMATTAQTAISVSDNVGISVTESTFTNIEGSDVADVVVVQDGAESVTFENNVFEGGGTSAEAILTGTTGDESLDLTVSGNTISGFDEALELSTADGVSAASVSENTFENNNVHVDDTTGATTLNDVFTNNDFSETFVTVEDSSGNIIDGIYGDLATADADTTLDGVAGQTTTIAGDHTANGITLDSNDNLVVTAADSGATITSNGAPVFNLAGSAVTNVEVSGITFDLSGGHTAISDGANAYEDIVVTNNEFVQVGGGATVLDLTSGIHTDLELTQNSFNTDDDASQYQAIDLDGASFAGSDTIEINGNTIDKADGGAISIDGGTGINTAAVNAEINDNTITNVSAVGVGVDIDVDDANDVTVQGNTISGDGGITGLQLSGALGSVVSVTNNEISGFSSDDGNGNGVGVELQNVDFTVENNILDDNAEQIFDNGGNYDLSTLQSQNTLTPVVRVLNQEGGTLQNNKLYGTVAGAVVDAGAEFVEVGAGTYTEQSVTVDAGMTIDGNSEATVTTDTANQIFLVEDPGASVIIEGLTFSPTDDNANADIRVDDPADTAGNGDAAQLASDVTVQNNVFSGPGTQSRQAVAVNDIDQSGGSVTVTVADNEFSNYAQAVEFDDTVDNDGNTHTLDIVRNTFSGNADGVNLVNADGGATDAEAEIRVSFNDFTDNTNGLTNEIAQGVLTDSTLDDDDGDGAVAEGPADEDGDVLAQANFFGSDTGPTDESIAGGEESVVDTDPFLEESFTSLPTDRYVVIPDPQSPIADRSNGVGFADGDAEARVLVTVLNDTKANQVTDTVVLTEPTEGIILSELDQAGSSAADPSTYIVEASQPDDYTLTARETDGSVRTGSATQPFTGSAADVEVTVDSSTLIADDQSTVNATITLIDSNGNVVDPTGADGVSFLVENGTSAATTRIVEEAQLDTSTPNSEARLELTAENAGETLEITGVFDPTGFSDTATVETVNEQLNVAVSPQSVTAGTETDVTINVTNAETDGSVEDADVELSGAGIDQTLLTDVNGTATTTVNASSAGTIDVNVTANGFEDATSTITVEEAQEPSVSVSFTDQTVPNGTEEVTVDSANFTRADGSAGDYVVVVHTIDEFGAPVGDVSSPIGASDDLTGAEENINVNLTAADGPINNITENVTLRAMLHTTADDSAFGTRLGSTSAAIDGIEPGDETDDANITVEDEQTVNVGGEDVPVEFTTTENGETTVTANNAVNAIDTFIAGGIDADTAVSVIDAFIASRS